VTVSAPERDHFRGFARRAVDLAAQLVATDGSWQRAGRVLDLGFGGARVLVSEVILPSTPLSLLIDAPQLWAPLELRASVAWTRDDPARLEMQLGLSFQPGAGQALLRLATLLDAVPVEPSF
jgi:hypothetical protein